MHIVLNTLAFNKKINGLILKKRLSDIYFNIKIQNFVELLFIIPLFILSKIDQIPYFIM